VRQHHRGARKEALPHGTRTRRRGCLARPRRTEATELMGEGVAYSSQRSCLFHHPTAASLEEGAACRRGVARGARLRLAAHRRAAAVPLFVVLPSRQQRATRRADAQEATAKSELEQPGGCRSAVAPLLAE